MNFYSVIIGTELLNGRRQDAHFSFLNKELLKRGWEQKASFVIKDEPPFIEDIFRLIKKDPDAVMFCFVVLVLLLMTTQEYVLLMFLLMVKWKYTMKQKIVY